MQGATEQTVVVVVAHHSKVMARLGTLVIGSAVGLSLHPSNSLLLPERVPELDLQNDPLSVSRHQHGAKVVKTAKHQDRTNRLAHHGQCLKERPPLQSRTISGVLG